MNAREERGLVIAALCKLNRKDDNEWLVPSQSGAETTYRVNPTAKTCTCPDHQEHGHKCKHVFAVEFTLKRETHSDGTMIETKTIVFTEKKSYKQNWPAYNTAQSVEKGRFQEILFDLLRDISEPMRKTGRKPHTYKDSLFAMAFKVFCTISSRRFSCDLRDAHDKGYLSAPIPGAKVPQFFDNEAFTPILKALIAKSALPLKAVESDFAIDSSGFGTSVFETWYDAKYGVTRRKCVWVKAHIACGVKTNVVTAIRILDKDAADSPQFEPLVRETAKGFTIGEVSADKAYLSYENFEAVANCGGTFFPAFKENSTGCKGGLFEKMLRYFQFKQEEYLSHYHKRSNVESTFSMIKAKFGNAVRSKTPTAMVNEVLCKILCHNLCVLNQEQHELGVEVEFKSDKETPKQLVYVKPVKAEPISEEFDLGDFRFSD